MKIEALFDRMMNAISAFADIAFYIDSALYLMTASDQHYYSVITNREDINQKAKDLVNGLDIAIDQAGKLCTYLESNPEATLLNITVEHLNIVREKLIASKVFVAKIDPGVLIDGGIVAACNMLKIMELLLSNIRVVMAIDSSKSMKQNG